MKFTFYLIILVAAVVYVSLELIKKYFKLEEVNQKSKELMNKVKSPQELDEETLKELLDIHKQMYKYMLTSSLLIICVIIILTVVFGKDKVIELPFTIPILNRNWIGAFGTYILCYFVISAAGSIAKKIYKSFIKKKANGEANSNTKNTGRKDNNSNKES